MNSPHPPGSPVAPATEAPSFPSLKQHLRDQELAYLQRALEQSGGDKKQAARLLDISLATLYRKLEPDKPMP